MNWSLSDLDPEDREVAERVLGNLFRSTPGSVESGKASAAYRMLDEAIQRRYGSDA